MGSPGLGEDAPGLVLSTIGDYHKYSLDGKYNGGAFTFNGERVPHDAPIHFIGNDGRLAHMLVVGAEGITPTGLACLLAIFSFEQFWIVWGTAVRTVGARAKHTTGPIFFGGEAQAGDGFVGNHQETGS